MRSVGGDPRGQSSLVFPLLICYVRSSQNKRLACVKEVIDWCEYVLDCPQYLALGSGLNRLCSVPPAARRRPPRRAASGSDRGDGVGSDCFQSDHHSARLGSRGGKWCQLSNAGLSGRNSQWRRHTKMESRNHQFGLHRGRG